MWYKYIDLTSTLDRTLPPLVPVLYGIFMTITFTETWLLYCYQTFGTPVLLIYTAHHLDMCYLVGLLDCFHTVSLLYYCKVKSDYINSDYSDVRYRVYIWGFPYLDYFFDVLISRIDNVSLDNWFSCSYFTYCLISSSYVLIFTIHLSCTRAWYARHLALSYVLAGLHLTTLNSL